MAEFRAALSHAEGSHDPAVQRRALEEAVSHYQGELVPGCYDEWIISERERLGIEYRAALERLAHLCEAERDYPSAIAYARSLLLVDSLDEETYRTLMRLHALNRDKSAALQIYHACVTIMEQELDLEPESATQAAYQRLVDAAPAMDVHLPAGALQAAWPLVGRRQEWEQVLAAWERSVRGEAHVVTLVGEAGSGKTRMGEEFLAWAVRQGIPVAETRCYATAGMLPFAPVAAWMRTDPLYQARSTVKGVWLTELARLLPEIMRNTLI